MLRIVVYPLLRCRLWLCGFNRVNFVKYRRGKDTNFELYTSLVADDVQAVKARILELFPRKDEPVWTLTVSHTKEMATWVHFSVLTFILFSSLEFSSIKIV